MNWTDLYSNQGTATQNYAGSAVMAGPNQSIVTQPMQAASASGAPAFAWLGMGLALVLLRVLIAMGGRVA